MSRRNLTMSFSEAADITLLQHLEGCSNKAREVKRLANAGLLIERLIATGIVRPGEGGEIAAAFTAAALPRERRPKTGTVNCAPAPGPSVEQGVLQHPIPYIPQKQLDPTVEDFVDEKLRVLGAL